MPAHSQTSTHTHNSHKPPLTHIIRMHHSGTFNAVDFMGVLKQLSEEYGEEASEGSVTREDDSR